MQSGVKRLQTSANSLYLRGCAQHGRGYGPADVSRITAGRGERPRRCFGKSAFTKEPPRRGHPKEVFAKESPQRRHPKEVFAKELPQRRHPKKVFAKEPPRRSLRKEAFTKEPPPENCRGRSRSETTRERGDERAGENGTRSSPEAQREALPPKNRPDLTAGRNDLYMLVIYIKRKSV